MKPINLKQFKDNPWTVQLEVIARLAKNQNEIIKLLKNLMQLNKNK